MLSFTDDLGVTDDPAKFDQAVRAIRRKVPVTDDEWDELTEAERQRAFKVAAVAQADIVQEVLDQLARAVEEGTPFEDFRDAVGPRLEEAWGRPDSPRIETIFRTNTLAAYNAGRHEIFTNEEVAAARPFWRYELIDDDALCEICGGCDGVILPADDPWWRTHIPPLHPRCRCTYSALSREEAEEEGLTSKAPDVDAADGFGAPPAPDDWEPDVTHYSAPIREALQRRLG